MKTEPLLLPFTLETAREKKEQKGKEKYKRNGGSIFFLLVDHICIKVVEILIIIFVFVLDSQHGKFQTNYIVV